MCMQNGKQQRGGLVIGSWLVLAGIALLACGGCASTGQEPIFTIAIHTFARKGNAGGGRAKAVSNYEGSKKVFVHSFAVITSRNITKATFLENETDAQRHTVRFYLDDYGARRWEQLCRQEIDGWCAVLVDGFYRFGARLPRRSKTFSIMDIVGPWEPVEGQHVANEAANNHTLTGFKPVHSVR
ncbi:MAG: hypothetical protein KAI66_03110 [Lentisphaeria bacterium]|nr:hypothetical protein [Lentisphaeria bacterium]